MPTDKEGVVTVYVPGPHDTKLYCNGTESDVVYIKTVLADLATKHPIDNSRVYATGFSLGRPMSVKNDAR